MTIWGWKADCRRHVTSRALPAAELVKKLEGELRTALDDLKGLQ